MSDESKFPPLLVKIPEGAQYAVCFLWKPIFAATREDAEIRLAELGDVETPEEFFRNAGQDTEHDFPVQKVIRLQRP